MNSQFNGSSAGITDSLPQSSLFYSIFAKINQVELIILIKRKGTENLDYALI